MATRDCYHCKQPVEEGEPHDCWTTTEAALTRDLTEDLREAWERLRETAASLGDQRIYASHNSIMFSRRSCYVFVRPKRKFLEVCVFLGRTLTAPQGRRSVRASSAKVAHILHVRHRDEVEAPMTDWLQEAYEYSGEPGARVAAKPLKPQSGRKEPARGKSRVQAKPKSRVNAEPKNETGSKKNVRRPSARTSTAAPRKTRNRKRIP
jgi:Mg-chelatase subunit ChlI